MNVRPTQAIQCNVIDRDCNLGLGAHQPFVVVVVVVVLRVVCCCCGKYSSISIPNNSR
jgi:hypothetical protein